MCFVQLRLILDRVGEAGVKSAWFDPEACTQDVLDAYKKVGRCGVPCRQGFSSPCIPVCFVHALQRDANPFNAVSAVLFQVDQRKCLQSTFANLDALYNAWLDQVTRCRIRQFRLLLPVFFMQDESTPEKDKLTSRRLAGSCQDQGCDSGMTAWLLQREYVIASRNLTSYDFDAL
jgi:hypothetical protein